MRKCLITNSGIAREYLIHELLFISKYDRSKNVGFSNDQCTTLSYHGKYAYFSSGIWFRNQSLVINVYDEILTEFLFIILYLFKKMILDKL